VDVHIEWVTANMNTTHYRAGVSAYAQTMKGTYCILAHRTHQGPGVNRHQLTAGRRRGRVTAGGKYGGGGLLQVLSPLNGTLHTR
jgi:hypothetical protein